MDIEKEQSEDGFTGVNRVETASTDKPAVAEKIEAKPPAAEKTDVAAEKSAADKTATAAKQRQVEKKNQGTVKRNQKKH